MAKEKHKILEAMHHLWCKAIGTKEYDKTEWIELEKSIIELIDRKTHNEAKTKSSKTTSNN